jgi:hypothetical protein
MDKGKAVRTGRYVNWDKDTIHELSSGEAMYGAIGFTSILEFAKWAEYRTIHPTKQETLQLIKKHLTK